MIVDNLLDVPTFRTVSSLVRAAHWQYGLTYGGQSRLVWSADVSKDQPLHDLVLEPVLNQLPGTWRATDWQAIGQTMRQPLVKPSEEPNACAQVIAQLHTDLLWQQGWHGATLVDDERIAYEPNRLIIWEAHSHVVQEAPIVENIIRCTLQIRLEHVY